VTADAGAALRSMIFATTRQVAVKRARIAYEAGASHNQLEAAWKTWSRLQDEQVQRIYTDPSLMCRCAHSLHDGARCPRRACGCVESRPQQEATA
jgi:hypothetical protein